MRTSATPDAIGAAPAPTQRGYRLRAWGEEPQWEEMPTPKPAPGEVLVEVEACGVGLTVLNALRGDLAGESASLPVVPGHELVGRVVAAGEASRQAARLLGRRVAAYFYLSCGECPECVGGREPLCRNWSGYVGVHRDGGYAPYVTLPAFNAVPMPDQLAVGAATVVPDAVATPVHVCRTRARVGPADRVLVIGAGGGVGIHMAQVARLYGARVAGVDVGEDKLAALEELGVLPVASRASFEEMDAAVWADGPPTVVIDLVGTDDSLSWAAAALAPGGRLVLLTPFPGPSLSLAPRDAVNRELAVIGSRYASRAEVRLAAELVAAGRVRAVIGAEAGPDGLRELHDRLRAGTLLGRGLLRWDPATTTTREG